MREGDDKVIISRDAAEMQENTYLEHLDYLQIRHVNISEIIEGVLDAVGGGLSRVDTGGRGGVTQGVN